MSAHPQPRLSPEQYLEIERAAEFKSEYYNGRIYAMPGGSYKHARVIANLTAAFFPGLKNGPCTVSSSDLRLRVAPNGLYTYPDITVVCSAPQFVDGQRDTLVNPILIAEVLSPSTEAYDRGWKFSQYRKIESLQEYALVSQTEPRIEVFRRQPSGDWLLSESVGLEAVCRLVSLSCTIALVDVYDRIGFEGEDALPSRPAPGS
jgi:Uma2 family endonuclease